MSRLTRGLSRSDGEIMLDEYLHGLGFWRKMIPKDGNCLFRIASEKLLCSQIFHEIVKELYENYQYHHQKLKMGDTCCLFQFLSLMMKKDFKIFWSSFAMKDCTSNNFDEKVVLCTVDDKHFDLVYTHDYVNVNALCQSIVYEMLYEGVFGVEDVIEKSKDMMSVKVPPCTPKMGSNQFFFPGHTPEAQYPRTVIAFPYKVAKSLSIDILRNVEYDAWLEVKKARSFGYHPFSTFDRNMPVPGDKCQVSLPGHGDIPFNAHIQEIQKERNTIVVFVEGLGEKHVVPADSVKLLAKPNQFDCFWKRRNRRKSCDSCSRGLFTKNIPMRYPSRALRINSAGHSVKLPFQERLTRDETDGGDNQKLKMLKERSCSDGHYRCDCEDIAEDELAYDQSAVNDFYCLAPGDDEVLVEENSLEVGVGDYSPENVLGAGSMGDPASPVGTNLNGMMTQMVQYQMPHVYSPAASPGSYMVIPVPSPHLLSYDNYPGAINFSAPPSVDPNGSDLLSQDISTSRFFFNLGLITYSGWLMMQNQQAPLQTISPSYISGAAGMYVAAQAAPAMVAPDVIMVANPDSFTNGGFIGQQAIPQQAGAFYYSAQAPTSPYIQVAPLQYHSTV